MPTHNDRPSLRQLEYLVAVAEEGSFSRAAERCFVSQPTLSGQIKLLETRIGVDCFERTSRGVLVTPHGEEIVARARETIAAVDRLLAAANAETEPLAGSLRLGVVSTVTPYLMPGVVAELAREAPSLDVTLHDDVGDRLKEALRTGALDAIVSPRPIDLDGVEELEIAFDPFVVVATADTPLGDLPEPVRMEDLGGAPILLLDDPHCIRGQALEICSQARCTPNLSLHATSISALVQLVRHGMGATLLPALSLDVELHWLKDLRVKRFADPVPGRQIVLAWRAGSTRRDGFLRLGHLLMEHADAKTSGYRNPPILAPAEDGSERR